MTKAYKAKWILTASEGDYKPCYENCALLVDNGKISDILPQNEICDEIYEAVEDFGNSIITPGFINLRANLQYRESTEYKKLWIKIKQFFAMLGTPIDNYAMKLADIEAEITSLDKNILTKIFKDNLKNELISGTTCLLQTVKPDKTGKMSFEILNKLPIKTFLMLEICADTVKKSNKIFKKIKAAYNLFKKEKNDSTYFGLNPKSVWQVHKKLWRFIGKFARRNNLAIMSELLESQEEFELLNNGFSYLVYYNRFLGNKKIPYENGQSSVEILKDLRILGTNLIIQNGNYLDTYELKALAENGVYMAFSPTVNKEIFKKNLSNDIILRYFSMQFGIMTGESKTTVAKELFNMNLPLPVEEQIKYATLYPAKMLKIDNIIGSLDFNKHADFNIFKLDKNQKSPADLKYNTKPSAVYILGHQVVKDGEIIK